MPLHSSRRKRFVAQYAIDLDAKAAAIRAGYGAKSAKKVGCALLKDPAIAAAIAENSRQDLARLEVTAERVLEAVAQLAFPDIRRLHRADGALKEIADLDDEAAAGVEWIEVDDRDRVSVRGIGRFDNLASLELLARHFGLLDERPAGFGGGWSGGRDEELLALMAAGLERAP